MKDDSESEKRLEEAAAKLGEHFDAVQILATWTEEGITKTCSRGSGNWHARQGMAHDFILRNHTYDQAVAISQELKEKE